MLKPLPIGQSATDAIMSAITFIVHTSFATHKLANALDSLVRVSRRVEWEDLVTIMHARKVTHSQATAHACTVKARASQHSLALHIRLESEYSQNIRAAGAELPCPKNYPHSQADGDTQGKKHHMHPDQNPQQHLH